MKIENRDQQRFIGYGMVAAGLLLFALFVSGANPFSILWPLFVMIPGFIFLCFSRQGEADNAALAVPGALIAGTGAILFYQNLTGHWASWAYMWTLYGVFLGLSFQYMDKRGMKDDEDLGEIGRYFVLFSSLLFIALAVFFEVLIFNDGNLFVSIAVPAVLIFIGLWFLSRSGDTTVEFGRFFDSLFSSVFAEPEKPKRKNEDLPGAVFVVESDEDTPNTDLSRQ